MGEMGWDVLVSPRGAALMGRRASVLFFLPTGIPCCWRQVSWLVAPLGLPPNHKQAPQGRPGGDPPMKASPSGSCVGCCPGLMFASGVVKLDSAVAPHGGGSLVRVLPGCAAVLGLCPALTAPPVPSPHLPLRDLSACPRRPPGLPGPPARPGCTSSACGHLPHRDRGAPLLLSRSCSRLRLAAFYPRRWGP